MADCLDCLTEVGWKNYPELLAWVGSRTVREAS